MTVGFIVNGNAVSVYTMCGVNTDTTSVTFFWGPTRESGGLL